jgi:hypothetical protein
MARREGANDAGVSGQQRHHSDHGPEPAGGGSVRRHRGVDRLGRFAGRGGSSLAARGGSAGSGWRDVPTRLQRSPQPYAQFRFRAGAGQLPLSCGPFDRGDRCPLRRACRRNTTRQLDPRARLRRQQVDRAPPPDPLGSRSRQHGAPARPRAQLRTHARRQLAGTATGWCEPRDARPAWRAHRAR